jgi:hypothetical protein
LRGRGRPLSIAATPASGPLRRDLGRPDAYFLQVHLPRCHMKTRPCRSHDHLGHRMIHHPDGTNVAVELGRCCRSLGGFCRRQAVSYVHCGVFDGGLRRGARPSLRCTVRQLP